MKRILFFAFFLSGCGSSPGAPHGGAGFAGGKADGAGDPLIGAWRSSEAPAILDLVVLPNLDYFAIVRGRQAHYRLHGTVRYDAKTMTFTVDHSDPVLTALIHDNQASSTGDDTQENVPPLIEGTWTIESWDPIRGVQDNGIGDGFFIRHGQYDYDGVSFYRRPSYCDLPADCVTERLAAPACASDGEWRCDLSTGAAGPPKQECSYYCRPDLDPTKARLRVNTTVQADGEGVYPIFLDYQDPTYLGAELQVAISRSGVIHDAGFTGASGTKDGWTEPFEARWILIPCDGKADPSCLGDATLTLTQNGHEILSQAITLVAPDENHAAAPCLGLGNVANFMAIETAGDGYALVPRIFGDLAWTAGYYDQEFANETVFHHYLNFATNFPHANFTDIVDNLSIDWDNGTLLDWSHIDSFDVQYGHWSIQFNHLTSQLTLHQLALDVTQSETSGSSANVESVTASWKLDDTLFAGVPARGCFHYEASNPTLAF